MMDIRAGVIALALLAVVAAYFSIRAAVKTMQTARKLSFYSLRKRHNITAWRMFFLA